MPPSRASCSATVKALSRRCAPELDVLEVAATAAARSGVRAERDDPVGGRGQDLDSVGPQVGGGAGGDAGSHALAREGVADEDDLPVRRPADAPAAGRDGADLEVKQFHVTRGGHGLGA